MLTIEGTVERITFQNEENYYTVARVEVRQMQGPITVVGCLPGVSVGETLQLTGDWFTHPTYGRQFRVASFETSVPATLAGIEKYLASGSIKGVGPATAKRIVDHFGMEALNVMDENPERLAEIPGIGPKKAATIGASFAQQREIRQVMLFLQSNGVSPTYAAKIYKQYGDQTIAIIRDNPYRLADDIFGIGFKTADKLAGQLGIPKDSPRRMAAGLRYALSQMANDGHVYIPKDKLFKTAGEMLEADDYALEQALEELLFARYVFREDDDEQGIYLAPFYYAELGVADRLLSLLDRQGELAAGDLAAEINAFEKEQGVTLAENQRLALRRAMESGVLVITGGPGTGKTTTINALIYLLEKEGLSVGLAAPTGRAAKRMTEATGKEAKTIHRLLEYSFVEGEGLQFQKNEKSPLAYDVLIVDEVSMVDMLLMYSLLKALKPGSRLILVGDKDQLPSVGPGNVLADIIRSGVVEVVELNEIFRQARESTIVVNAHRINKGQYPIINNRSKDFFFIEEEDPEKILEQIIELCVSRLPNFGEFHPVDDIQVLTPMRRTLIGVENLNQHLQQALNPPASTKPEIKVLGTVFRLGDKVMQIKNNYDKSVYNGDIGRIVSIDREEGEVILAFPEPEGERLVPYDNTELDECVLAYATSIHKSQGSEYPVVVMPVSTTHYMMLQRNLLYTGVTRAKQMVVLLGTKKALGMAVRNNRTIKRYTRLAERLRQGETERVAR